MWEHCFPPGPYGTGRCIPDDLQCERGKETRKGNLCEEGVRLRFSLLIENRGAVGETSYFRVSCAHSAVSPVIGNRWQFGVVRRLLEHTIIAYMVDLRWMRAQVDSVLGVAAEGWDLKV
jgi:hypothetical protein